MERILVIGASGGIGAALLAEAGRRGSVVRGLSRRADGLDITSEPSLRAVLSRLDGPFDAVIVATGALEIGGARPEKSLRAVDPAALAAQFAINAIGPLLVLRHVLALMPRDRPARFAALSARVGSIGDNRLGGWYGYRAAKAALNQYIRTAAVEVARSHPQAVLAALHPGTVATPLTEAYRGTHPAITPAAAAADLLDALGRLGPGDSGGFFDRQGRAIPW